MLMVRCARRQASRSAVTQPAVAPALNRSSHNR